MEPQFQNSFERHLLPQQRRAVLEALADSVPQDATVGDIIDAARALGWSGPMGTLTLQDFANALLGESKVVPEAPPSPEPEPEFEAEVEAEVEVAPEPAEPKPARKKVASKKSTKTANAALAALKSKLDADEPMSLDEAAEVLVPIVSKMETATMQQLEEFTGIGRRKLRFHIGQLVRHEYLERHGMGRGTYYTACS